MMHRQRKRFTTEKIRYVFHHRICLAFPYATLVVVVVVFSTPAFPLLMPDLPPSWSSSLSPLPFGLSLLLCQITKGNFATMATKGYVKVTDVYFRTCFTPSRSLMTEITIHYNHDKRDSRSYSTTSTVGFSAGYD
jgi:hypothetical protein